MKKLLLLFLAFTANDVFSQCPFNLDFEQGTTAGWFCESGAYGLGPCPTPASGACPTFQTAVATVGSINVNGVNAALNTGVDRHTIVDKNYYGTGIDPNSLAPHLISVVGSGNYSFRLGDGVAGGEGLHCPGPPPDCYTRSEAMGLIFKVTSQNALFTYRYAAFIQDPGHWPEEQPSFETVITKPDSGFKLIPCGYTKIKAGGFNAACPATSIFHVGNGVWKYTDWTDVALDLSSYIGENLAIEFRTHDCFPGGNAPNVTCDPVTGCCTTTQNGVSCKDSISGKCSGPPWCTGTPACNNQAGNHSCYAYIDASCAPVPQTFNIIDTVPSWATSVTICAPPGFACYMWNNQSSPTTQCITVSNPTTSTVYNFEACSSLNCLTPKGTITIYRPVGVNELSDLKNLIKISPNPVLSSFIIDLNPSIKDADLTIYDMLGRLQLQKHLTTNRTEIPAGTLKSGAYFARVRIGEWQYTRKLVVE